MFGEGSHWEERIKKIRWKDAENALRHIEEVYVERPDFRPITEQGLEQILILANSKTARETFENLQDDDKREEFVARVQKHLDQTRDSPHVGRADCVQRFRRVIRSINRETVEFPEPLLVSELMRGALDPLDDFTSIIWPQASREFDKRTRGDFVGVGISIIKNRAGEIEVVTPLDNAPAYRAGVQAGDIIIKVDGEPFEKNISINSVVDIITGPQGTPVQLTIRRDTKELEFDLQREKVKIQSVKGVKRRPNDPETWDHWLDRDMGIGYIRVTNFQRNTVEDVANVVLRFIRRPAEEIVNIATGTSHTILDLVAIIGETVGKTLDPNERRVDGEVPLGPFERLVRYVDVGGGSGAAQGSRYRKRPRIPERVQHTLAFGESNDVQPAVIRTEDHFVAADDR
ncbi:MAG: PDZ domain-containing protein [Planctomycetes bacterium]|nr:PDZ domain-containing protein [Planctomycetota bacterium]